MGVMEEFRAVRQGYAAQRRSLEQLRLNWAEFVDLTIGVLDAWQRSAERLSAITNLPTCYAGKPFLLYGIEIIPDPKAPPLFHQSHPRRYSTP